ncbi:MAG TPA: hypothetical protein VLH09_11490 [Bryobacteraceae bacterium]|nr:hypothetical protein [Bryobacteraceae bacterium]
MAGQAASSAVVLFMLAAGQIAYGQAGAWDKVQAIPTGTKVQVSLAKDKTVDGTLAQVSEEGLALDRKGGPMQIAGSDIRRVWVLGKGSRLKRAGIAALVGFAIGCPIGAGKAGYIGDTNHPSLKLRGGFCLALGGFGAGVAAGVTAPFPATKYTLVYRAPDAKP